MREITYCSLNIFNIFRHNHLIGFLCHLIGWQLRHSDGELLNGFIKQVPHFAGIAKGIIFRHDHLANHVKSLELCSG